MDDQNHKTFMDMPFARTVMEMPYEKRLALLFRRLQSDRFYVTAADLDLWCGGDHVRKEWFTSNHEYWACNIKVKTLLRQCGAGKLPLFVDWHKIKMFSTPPARLNEVYLTVADWWLKYECSRLLYVPTPPVFAYCSGFYMVGGNGREQIISIAKTEGLVMSFELFLPPVGTGMPNTPSVIHSLMCIWALISCPFRRR